MFRMQKEDNQWRIVPQPLPTWVSNAEQNFHDLIEEALA
jgi:hypothetical protein